MPWSSQDVRGRYGSEGEFVPYLNEGRDGYDTIEWAAAQPWSDRRDRHVRPFLSGRRAVARGRRVAAAPEGDGAGHDVLVAAQLLLRRRRLGPLVARLDLEQHRAGRARAREPRRARAPGKEARVGLERTSSTILPYRLPLTDLPGAAGRRAVLLRLARAPSGGCLLGLGGAARAATARVGAAVLNFSGWHDETYGPGGRDHELPRPARGARRARRTRARSSSSAPGSTAGEDSDHSGERKFGPKAPIDYAALDPATSWTATSAASTTASTASRACARSSWERTRWRTGDTLAAARDATPSRSISRRAASSRARRPAVAVVGERVRLGSRRSPSSTRTAPTPARTTTARSRRAPTSLVFETEPLEREPCASSERSRPRSISLPTRPTPTSGSSSRTSRRTARPGISRARAPTSCARASGNRGPNGGCSSPASSS